MAAERSPSPISLIRAPVARMSAMSCAWRGRSSTVITRSSTSRLERRGDRAQVVGDRCIEIDRRATAVRHDQLLHVEVGRVQEPAFLRRRQHRDRARRAGGAEVGALERIDRDIDLWRAEPAAAQWRRWPARPSRR